MSSAPHAYASPSVKTMSEIQSRGIRTRKRGEGKSKVQLNGTVDPAIKAKVDRVAATLGMSQAAAMELMLDSIGVDANGRPEFWDGPLATDNHQELPLANSA